jgi:CHAT domain-containing protein
VTEQLDWLRFALSRLARLPRGAVQRTALRDGARASARALELALLAPLAEALGERELVIVPTGSLHALPWAMLPALRGRALAVAPSAGSWVTLGSAGTRRRGRAVLAAGPGLRHASAELRAIAPLHPRAVTLRGASATVPAVLRALDGASVAHLACHGRFRADSPLFSSLELADGPLNVYELQRLRRAPELIVLSACDLALSDRRPGDELLGFAAALLEMGTRAVIASGVAVPDAAVVRLMIRLHELLADGRSPATALAIAQRDLASRTIELGGFVCLGRG